MGKGKTHKASSLKDNEQGSYIFTTDNTCLKVGYAGKKSNARWSSNH